MRHEVTDSSCSVQDRIGQFLKRGTMGQGDGEIGGDEIECMTVINNGEIY